MAETETELFLGVAPSIRRADENDAKLDHTTMPILVARREGENLSSAFVSILEPYRDKPFIASAERLQNAGQGIAIKVTHGDITDFILVGFESNGMSCVQVGDMKLRGRIGCVRMRDGKVETARLIGGNYLSKGSYVLEANGPVSGKILKVFRKANGDEYDGFAVDVNVSHQFEGAAMIVAHPDGFTHGYEIKNIMKAGEQTIIAITDEPGFEIDENTTRLLFFPQRESVGDNNFYLANVVEEDL